MWTLRTILRNHANANYGLFGSKLMSCHITTVVVVHIDCSGFLGPRSEMGHYGLFYAIEQNVPPPSYMVKVYYYDIVFLSVMSDGDEQIIKLNESNVFAEQISTAIVTKWGPNFLGCENRGLP